ncbi:reverse transcriptase domain-containing protein, partial [Tanacetum coccineum]
MPPDIFPLRHIFGGVTKNLSPEGLAQLKSLLKRNNDIFAWEPSDMTGMPKRITKHSLNVNPSVTPVKQKRRVFCPEKILVKKADGSRRMCIDFKNINSACPKDYYALPKIDDKIEAVMGFPLKCFLDAYKGYHQVQMADEDEEKTAFYTDQGTYCYTKMPFGLKNAGATYQRLVDEAFRSQIRKNLEVYIDDIMVKSKTEREMLADIAYTSQPSENERHSGDAVTKNLGRNANHSGKTSGTKPFPVL